MTASEDGESDLSAERCGYTYSMSTLSGEGAGAVTCWRPTWNDHGRCIWHANVGEKPSAEFEAAASEGHERLDGAIIPEVELRDADWFEESVLIGATFTDADLRGASFVGADLREASFDHVDAREADFADANFEGASISDSDLRAVSLVDARFDQAVISNVRIDRQTDFGEESVYERELSEGEDADENVEDEESYLLTAEAAIWSYREIQKLHRENALPFGARTYYFKEKNMRRRIAWRTGSYRRALKAEGSRWVTGYGMNPWRVIAAAAVVIVACAIIYPVTGGIQETVTQSVEPVKEAANATNATNVTDKDPTTKTVTVTWSIDSALTSNPYALFTLFLRSLYFSVITFTTLGYGDIQPIGNVARAVAGIESLVGAMLTALLVFVLSRRIS
jgi:voltage-gated potassium channel Kch